jgi:hypothetical protein
LEIGQVVLCRQLFLEAERYAERDGAVSLGLAVSIAQDSVELFLRAVMKDRPVAGVKLPDEFSKCMDYIDQAGADDLAKKIPFRGKLLELNKARVNFKHYGLIPDRHDARRLLGYVEQFFEEAGTAFFGVVFSKISLADSLAESGVRDAIKKAEEAFTGGYPEEALGLCAEAVELSTETLLRTFNRKSESLAFFTPMSLMSAFGHEGAREMGRYIKDVVQASQRVSLVLALALNVHELSRFESMMPVLHAIPGGRFNRQWMVDSSVFTPQDVSFAIDFATRYAIGVSSRMLGGSLEPVQGFPQDGLRIEVISPQPPQ